MDVTVKRVLVCTGVGSAIDVGGKMRNGEMGNEYIFNRVPIFFYLCFFFFFFFWSSFSTRMVFKKINTLLILMVVGMRIVRKNVVVLEEVHDG